MPLVAVRIGVRSENALHTVNVLRITGKKRGGTMKKLRIGVFGAGRGMDLAGNFMLLNCDIVALCDSRRHMLDQWKDHLSEGGQVYEDFDAFIQHDMDAVILANNFHEHASYAIRCMEKGLHVFSECISNGTMGEGVALIRAFEKSHAIYMLAENYPQMLFNLEMQQVCKGGTLGKILFAEGEYNHPTAKDDTWFLKTYSYHENHWRYHLPATYYITHSLGPVMRATGATPVKVSAHAIYAPDAVSLATHNGDNSAIITTQNDDGSVFRVVGCSGFGAHGNSYRLCGTKGQIENLRGMNGKIMLRYNEWQIPEGREEINLYDPVPLPKEEMPPTAGHGGSDYLTAKMFLQCIREGRQPDHPFDIHSAVAMSSVAILGHRSVLEGGKPYDIPNFHREADRRLYENDFLSPFPSPDGTGATLPCCSHPDYRPTKENLEIFHRLISEE
ncbi:MAG: Gfo/Idh/MocA family oxidoreductase [Clostridiales bacterium]|nr:Gfo/Idh/MocA family oxidoreductase [Clostridiales bacterium]